MKLILCLTFTLWVPGVLAQKLELTYKDHVKVKKVVPKSSISKKLWGDDLRDKLQGKGKFTRL